MLFFERFLWEDKNSVSASTKSRQSCYGEKSRPAPGSWKLVQHTRNPGSEMMARAVGVGPRTGQAGGIHLTPPQEPFLPTL